MSAGRSPENQISRDARRFLDVAGCLEGKQLATLGPRKRASRSARNFPATPPGSRVSGAHRALVRGSTLLLDLLLALFMNSARKASFVKRSLILNRLSSSCSFCGNFVSYRSAMGQSLVLIGLICLFGVGGVQCTEDLLRSMEEFRQKIEQSFESHSRIQYVEKDVQKQLEGWIDVSSRDFSQDSERVANKMQTFLNHRLEAIRRIVSTSESEADAFVYTTYRAVVLRE
ncbi:hypothetical protein L596_002885 [Steinernema carpocapsae]|uniref:Uncharacterized protein n=1 Tax=Steinernema carpocapsae TaxID=34508 RepID=A0A4U8UQS4_STECR|nr:hypothetical protein L596_002885 [Steinernema carpocapsae]